MGKKDQEMRLKGKWSPIVDKKNTKILQKIIDENGWPAISLVGEDAENSAWLVAQHSPSLDFQKKCLKLLLEAAKNGEAKKRNVPYLMDRILTRENKKQIYGTQFRVVKGKFEPFPIQGILGIDQRRKKFELGSFKSYAKKFDNRDVARFKSFFKKNKKSDSRK